MRARQEGECFRSGGPEWSLVCVRLEHCLYLPQSQLGRVRCVKSCMSNSKLERSLAGPVPERKGLVGNTSSRLSFPCENVPNARKGNPVKTNASGRIWCPGGVRWQCNSGRRREAGLRVTDLADMTESRGSHGRGWDPPERYVRGPYPNPRARQHQPPLGWGPRELKSGLILSRFLPGDTAPTLPCRCPDG